MARLIRLWLAAHASRCAPADARPDAWAAAGRDPVEKATALGQLALLLCREGRFTEARDVTGQAVKLMPESFVLWRMLVGLSAADLHVVRTARRFCPLDPDLWLAELVLATRTAPDADESEVWGEPEVIRRLTAPLDEDPAQAPAVRYFSPAAVARAAAHLLDRGMPAAAALAAREATSRARGLLPVHLVGLRCAIALGDAAWAGDCTRLAIAASLEPRADLFRRLADLSAHPEALVANADLLQALKNLRLAEPEEPRWAQMLGHLRFERGGWETVDAFYQLNAALESGATNRAFFVMAAEASRRLGNPGRAADILRQGLSIHPGDLVFLNNLAMTLADSTGTVREACALLPDIEPRAGNDLSVWDTVALVSLRAGDLDKADRTARDVLAKAPAGSALGFRANRFLAEIALARNRRHEAQAILESLLRAARGMPDEDVVAVNRLLMEIAE